MTGRGFGQLALAGVLGLSLGVISAPAQAQSADATRARVDIAALPMPEPAMRQCWARFAPRDTQTRKGVIEEVAFRVPCPEVMSPQVIKTLQRALMARGYHDGPVTGVDDAQTRSAVQAFQRDNGFDSPILTLETARRLGLVPIEITRN